MKQKFRSPAKWLFAVVLLAGLIWWNWPGLQDQVDKVRQQGLAWNHIWLAVSIYLIALALTFMRWHILVLAQSLPFRLVDAFRLGLVGFFFNNFLPGAISGDLVKAYFLHQEQQQRTVAIGTIFADRVIGLVGLIFLTAGVGALHWQEAWGTVELRWVLVVVWTLAAGLLVAGLAIALMPWPFDRFAERVRPIRRVGPILAELLRCCHMYQHKRQAVLVATALAILGHVGFVSSFYFCAKSLRQPIPSFESQFLLVPIGMVVLAVPLLPGGNLGVGEGVFEELYKLKLGAATGAGFMACIVQRLVSWAVALLGLLCYLPLRPTMRRLTPVQPAQGDDQGQPAPFDGRPTKDLTASGIAP